MRLWSGPLRRDRQGSALSRTGPQILPPLFESGCNPDPDSGPDSNIRSPAVLGALSEKFLTAE